MMNLKTSGCALIVATASLFGAEESHFIGYLPVIGPGPLRFQAPILSKVALPPWPEDLNSKRPPLNPGRTAVPTEKTAPTDADLSSRVPDLFPDLSDEPETNSCLSALSPSLAEPMTLNTNNAVITPQMLVPFFRVNAFGTNGSAPSLLMPINVAPGRPGPAPSSKATLTNP